MLVVETSREGSALPSTPTCSILHALFTSTGRQGYLINEVFAFAVASYGTLH